MTTLAPTPLMVAMIQTAATLPMALFALPAGALADIFDRKKILISTQVWRIFVSAVLGLTVILGYASPAVLLVATFALGFGTALGAPATQAIIPDMVEREEIPEAVMLNAVSVNGSRGAGPAIGGFIVAALGPGGTFLLNAASVLWSTMVLGSWKRTVIKSILPEEELGGAIRSGIRFVRNSQEVKSILLHTATFSFCASAMWSLIPIVAKQSMGLTSVGYGSLLGIFGLGGIIGLITMSGIRRLYSLNILVTGSLILFSLVLFAMAYGNNFWILACTMLIAGASWLALLSSLMAALQSITPAWVLGRVMSIHALIFFGTQAGGSAFWGTAADLASLPIALAGAGVLMLLTLVITYRSELTTGENLDLRPYQEWVLAPLHSLPEMGEGPVLVSLEYEINPEQASDFIQAMGPVKSMRKQYGAVSWFLFKDVSDPSHYRESFIVGSWVEHMRQHDRFTMSDRTVLNHANSFAKCGMPHKVDHFIAENVVSIKVKK